MNKVYPLPYSSKCPSVIKYWRPDQVAESMVSCYSALYSTLWSFVPDMETRMKKADIPEYGLFQDADPEFSMSYYWSKLSYSEQLELINYIEDSE